MRFPSSTVIALAAICSSQNFGATAASVAKLRRMEDKDDNERRAPGQHVRRANSADSGGEGVKDRRLAKKRVTRAINGVSLTTDEDGAAAYEGHYLFTSNDSGNGQSACNKLRRAGVTDCEWYENIRVGSFAVPEGEGRGDGAKEMMFLERALLNGGALAGLVEKVDADSEVFALALPDSNTLWGLDFSDGDGTDNFYTYRTIQDASKIYIAIMDTGVKCTHEQFDNVSCDNSYVASGITGDGDDRNGHGTHCAGTAIGRTTGVAKGLQGANLLSYKVLGDSGSGSYSGIAAALNALAVTATNNPDNRYIASLSLDGGFSSTVNGAVDALAELANAHVVVAAGNSNADACNFSPASASKAISVGSITETKARSDFSNWGTCVDIFAPGSLIQSSWYTGNTDYRTISGTSMACPHVAGAVAILVAAGYEVDSNLSNLKRENCGITSVGADSPNVCLTTEASMTTPPPTTTTTGSGTLAPTTTPIPTTTTESPNYRLTAPSDPWWTIKGFFFDLTAGASTVGIKSLKFETVSDGQLVIDTMSPSAFSDGSTFGPRKPQWKRIFSGNVMGGYTYTVTFGSPYLIPAGQSRPFHFFSTGGLWGRYTGGTAAMSNPPQKYPDYVSDNHLTLSQNFAVPYYFDYYYWGGYNMDGLEVEYSLNAPNGVLGAESAADDEEETATLEAIPTAFASAADAYDPDLEILMAGVKPKNAECVNSSECESGECLGNGKCE